MRSKLIQIDGLWWPEKDKECRKAVMAQYKDADHAIAVCRGFSVAIQAGGNCGIWAGYLSSHFDTVYTFEPDIDNFLCLNLNVPQENVVRLQAALGLKGEPISMITTPQNVGAHRVGDAGAVPVMRVDDLHLRACDLIQFDLEGYEYYALRGAQKTIDKYRPVIMLEDKGHHQKYGIDRAAIDDLLEKFGYKLLKKINRDIIMVPGDFILY